MAKIYLFGSRARGDHKKTSDFDVFVIGEGDLKLTMQVLEPYCVELGGNLDLFHFAGDCLLAVFGERRIFGKWDLHGVAEDAKEITLEELISHPDLKFGGDYGRLSRRSV
jgi:hypothetical protein